MEKITFQLKNGKDILTDLGNKKERKIFNFLNLHDIYQWSNEPNFRKSLLSKANINFVDGFLISSILSLKNFKRISRTRGPTFTKEVLSNQNFLKNQKHFFIGIEKEDINSLKRSFPHLKKVSCYNLPYIKEVKFSREELEKVLKKIKKESPDIIWVGIGSPKQNILSLELFERTNKGHFMNIGAGLDFFLGKKKEAPKIIQKVGIEWFYRLITDFKN